MSGVAASNSTVDHQGEIEQQRRQRGAVFVFQKHCAALARRTSWPGTRQQHAAQTRTPNGVSPNSIVPARITQAMAGG